MGYLRERVEYCKGTGIRVQLSDYNNRNNELIEEGNGEFRYKND